MDLACSKCYPQSKAKFFQVTVKLSWSGSHQMVSLYHRKWTNLSQHTNCSGWDEEFCCFVHFHVVPSKNPQQQIYIKICVTDSHLFLDMQICFDIGLTTRLGFCQGKVSLTLLLLSRGFEKWVTQSVSKFNLMVSRQTYKGESNKLLYSHSQAEESWQKRLMENMFQVNFGFC